MKLIDVQILDTCLMAQLYLLKTKEGMKTLRKSGIEEVLNCTTTLEEIVRVVDMRME